MYPYVLSNTHDNELFETELARIILAARCPSLIQAFSTAIIEYIDRYKEKITSPVSSERWK